MVAGMERYYQIARATGTRTSAPTASQVHPARHRDVLRRRGRRARAGRGHRRPLAAHRRRREGAVRADDLPRGDGQFGTDKPDLRFETELVECTEFFKDTTFRVFQQEYVGAVVVPGGASQPRKQLDAWQEWAKQRGAKGTAYVLVEEDGTLGPVAKNSSPTPRRRGWRPTSPPRRATASSSRPARERHPGRSSAQPASRSANCNLIIEDAWSFLWVIDAPLFEPTADAEASGDVALGYSARTWSPRLHLTEGRVPQHLRHRPGPTYGLLHRVRPRLQRQRDRYRSVSAAATCRSACSRSWACPTRRRGRSSGSPRRLPVRRRPTAASRSAGTGSSPCWRARSPSATSSPSPSPAAATTR